jgi:outer membrane scaffolding protein for murein synthesis (MipA/OmpV family)
VRNSRGRGPATTASGRFAVLIAGIASCLPPAALARQANEEAYAGLGLRLRPAYEGADTRRGQVIPYLRYYGEHWFARTTQGMLEAGARARPVHAVVFGAQLAYEDGRVSDESAFLRARNFEDIHPGASAGVHAEIDWNVGPMPLNALARYRRHFDPDLGTQADLRLTAGIYSRARLKAGVFGQLTWSDRRATQSYFGVTAEQAAASGLPQYAAGAGLRSGEVGALGAVELSRHWLALWSFSGRRLLGDAGDSPLALDSSNWYASAGVAYRF